MSMRYKGGILSATPPATTTSYGNWTLRQQMQAKGASTWPTRPGTTTIGTATAGVINCASVTFTAPACIGYPTSITYTATSTPGSITNTGSSSPIVVSGLTNGTSYTFKVKATNTSGSGACSAASNSITANVPSCQTYTTAGTYSFVVPSGVTSIATVVVGGGNGSSCQYGGGGGALSYVNAISVTPGETLTAVVGAGGLYNAGLGGISRLHRSCTTLVSTVVSCAFRNGQTVGVGTGGSGGSTNFFGHGGSGAGGYSGTGGIGQGICQDGGAGSGGGGGGGSGKRYNVVCCVTYISGGGGGGGVGIYGSGSSGAGGTSPASSPSPSASAGGGGGGSSGTAGGTSAIGGTSGTTGGAGGAYGGGGGTTNTCGRGGAVRIVWYSATRGTPSFPSTNVGP